MMSAISPSKRPRAAEMARLPLRVYPEDDEPILSFMVRLATANQLDQVNDLIATAGLPYTPFRRLARLPLDLTGLTCASGITENRLRYMQYLAAGTTHVTWLGRSVRRELVCSKLRRWCPVCLGEMPYHRAVWDLLPFGGCHRHKAVLASRCHGCSKEVEWAGNILACQCGTDLRLTETQPISEAAAEAITFFVSGLMVHREGVGDNLWLATALGWLSRPGQISQPTERMLWKRRDTRASELEIGWLALQDWPLGFLTYLTRHFPPERQLWPIVRWIERQYEGPLKGDMSAALKEYSHSADRDKYGFERRDALLKPRDPYCPRERVV